MTHHAPDWSPRLVRLRHRLFGHPLETCSVLAPWGPLFCELCGVALQPGNTIRPAPTLRVAVLRGGKKP